MALEVRYDLADGDQQALSLLYAGTWFGDGRTGAALDRMLEDTDAMVALYDGGELVAFGHAVTDGAFVAYLRDVVVAERYRGNGFGRRLVGELRTHPALADVAEVTLTCPERLAPVYEGCGFSPREGAIVMRTGDS